MKLKVFVFLLGGLLVTSCGNSSKDNISRKSIVQDTVASNVAVQEPEDYKDDNVSLINALYPNNKVKCLLPDELYYRAYAPGGKVHLIKIENGKIAVDEIFPYEYSDIAVILKVKDKLLVGINWSGQSKVVTLTDKLKPIYSKIYSYPDGEWTHLDSLSMVSENIYYAEFRTDCGDCDDGINLYRIKAKLNHQIISSSVEAIGEFAAKE